MKPSEFPKLSWIIWSILAIAAGVAIVEGQWSVVFISITAIVMTLLPAVFSERFNIRLPLPFLAAISVFVFATLFLGEVFDFYNRFWWWDVVLHGFSAMSFGIIGFLFVFFLFEGDKYAAPPWALGLMAFCFALSIGALWEIFEFTMDQVFGLNMQKSGLIDTMWDLIVDTGGALLGASAGFLYLKGQTTTLSGMIEEFVELNRTGYRKLRARTGRRRSK